MRPVGYATGSCTRILQIIPEASIRGTIPPFQHAMRGRCHDSTPVFLSAGADRPGVAVPDALLGCGHLSPLQLDRRHPSQSRHPASAHAPPTLYGLTRKPPCDACDRASRLRREPPCAPPPPHGLPARTPASGRHLPAFLSRIRTVAIAAGSGWATSAPMAIPAVVPGVNSTVPPVEGYFLETHGTLFHGKRVSVDLIVRVIGCLAEGLGIRATARVFEVDPNTVLQWLVEAAEQLQAFSQYFLHDVRVTQVQLDELYAVLSARQGR